MNLSELTQLLEEDAEFHLGVIESAKCKAGAITNTDIGVLQINFDDANDGKYEAFNTMGESLIGKVDRGKMLGFVMNSLIFDLA